MDTPEDSARNHAEQIAEASRALNHALIHRGDFAVGGVYPVVGDLAISIHRSSEAVEHLAAILALRSADRFALRADDHSNPVTALRSAAEDLAIAQRHLLEAAEATRSAQNLIAKIADRHRAETSP